MMKQLLRLGKREDQPTIKNMLTLEVNGEWSNEHDQTKAASENASEGESEKAASSEAASTAPSTPRPVSADTPTAERSTENVSEAETDTVEIGSKATGDKSDWADSPDQVKVEMNAKNFYSRKPHADYRDYYTFENLIYRIGKRKPFNIRTTIVYSDLHPLMRTPKMPKPFSRGREGYQLIRELKISRGIEVRTVLLIGAPSKIKWDLAKAISVLYGIPLITRRNIMTEWLKIRQCLQEMKAMRKGPGEQSPDAAEGTDLLSPGSSTFSCLPLYQTVHRYYLHVSAEDGAVGLGSGAAPFKSMRRKWCGKSDLFTRLPSASTEPVWDMARKFWNPKKENKEYSQPEILISHAHLFPILVHSLQVERTTDGKRRSTLNSQPEAEAGREATAAHPGLMLATRTVFIWAQLSTVGGESDARGVALKLIVPVPSSLAIQRSFSLLDLTVDHLPRLEQEKNVWRVGATSYIMMTDSTLMQYHEPGSSPYLQQRGSTSVSLTSSSGMSSSFCFIVSLTMSSRFCFMASLISSLIMSLSQCFIGSLTSSSIMRLSFCFIGVNRTLTTSSEPKENYEYERHQQRFRVGDRGRYMAIF
ncbi:unnamed protein product, partial [Nesidiocoris tenuis]